MTTPGTMFVLAIVTLLAAAAFGIWQARRAKQANEVAKSSAFYQDKA